VLDSRRNLQAARVGLSTAIQNIRVVTVGGRARLETCESAHCVAPSRLLGTARTDRVRERQTPMPVAARGDHQLVLDDPSAEFVGRLEIVPGPDEVRSSSRSGKRCDVVVGTARGIALAEDNEPVSPYAQPENQAETKIRVDSIPPNSYNRSPAEAV